MRRGVSFRHLTGSRVVSPSPIGAASRAGSFPVRALGGLITRGTPLPSTASLPGQRRRCQRSLTKHEEHGASRGLAWRLPPLKMKRSFECFGPVLLI